MEYAHGALAYGLSNTSFLLTSCLKSSLEVRSIIKNSFKISSY